jgi:hypothetical protein
MYPSVLLKIPLVMAMLMMMVKVMAAPNNIATNLQYALYLYTKNMFKIYFNVLQRAPVGGKATWWLKTIHNFTCSAMYILQRFRFIDYL